MKASPIPRPTSSLRTVLTPGTCGIISTPRHALRDTHGSDGRRSRGSVTAGSYGNRLALRDLLRLPLEGGGQPEIVENARPEVRGDATNGRDRVVDQRRHGGQFRAKRG